MHDIHLTGQLVCKTADEAAVVVEHLAQHVKMTRAESGCLSFDVTSTADAMVWMVAEHFESEHAFKLHQERVSRSDWGRATAGIERRYSIRGLVSPEA
jgi:quinol monooxygenase YgiN